MGMLKYKIIVAYPWLYCFFNILLHKYIIYMIGLLVHCYILNCSIVHYFTVTVQCYTGGFSFGRGSRVTSLPPLLTKFFSPLSLLSLSSFLDCNQFPALFLSCLGSHTRSSTCQFCLSCELYLTLCASLLGSPVLL